jgi:hypothetical protein
VRGLYLRTYDCSYMTLNHISLVRESGGRVSLDRVLTSIVQFTVAMKGFCKSPESWVHRERISRDPSQCRFPTSRRSPH